MSDMQQEERVEALEEALEETRSRLAALERRPRGGGAAGGLPSLVNDLDDLGTVKTYLEFDETATPGAPPAAVGRLYARSGPADAWLLWLNESAQEQTFILWQDKSNVSIARGNLSCTVANGTRLKTGSVTHNIGWTSIGVVLGSIQNTGIFAGGEHPVTVEFYNITATTFSYAVAAHANVAGDRLVSVGWYADGII